MPYICMNCGKQFETPVTVSDNHGLPFFCEKHRVSPCCHDTFMGTMTCAACDAEQAKGTDYHGLCRKCAEATVEQLCYFLYNEFTEAQRQVLNDAFDGVALTEPDKAKVMG